MPEIEALSASDFHTETKPFETSLGDYSVNLTPEIGVEITLHRNRRIIPINYRSIEKYQQYRVIPPDFVPSTIAKNLQVVEVGPGLSELLPVLARDSTKPPIAIDPLNYELVQDLLITCLRRQLSASDRLLINELIFRTNIYQDPAKIRLYNIGIEDCDRYEELRNVADVVIDIAGGLTYTPDPLGALNLIQTYLLKPDPYSRFFHAY